MMRPHIKPLTSLAFILLAIFGAQQVSRDVDAKMVVVGIQEQFEEQPAVPNLELPQIESLPSFEGASEWMNGERDREFYFRDKPVLVHFWSHSCIQCVDDLSYMKQWYSTYRSRGLEVVSIHAPSYVSEQRLERVKDAVKDTGIKYPVAFDQNFVIWHKFYNRFWPTTYLFDKEHELVYSHVGTGSYADTEAAIQSVLGLEPEDLIEPTPEEEVRTYIPLGHYKQYWYGGVEKILRSGSQVYSLPEQLAIETWALEGEWEFTDLTTSLVEGAGRFQIRVDQPTVNISFSVKDFHQTKVHVYLDGGFVPKEYAGEELRVDSNTGESYFYIEAQKHYQLFKNLQGAHTVEVRTDYPGVTLHSVTFPDRLQD
jgi:thiol-disulfide isomerase/thioredoxin